MPCRTVSPRIDDEAAYLDIDSLAPSLQRLAHAKAQSIRDSYPQDVVIAADTVVLCDRHLLGKPRDASDAARMIRMLSGREHTVWTAVAVQCARYAYTAGDTACTRVVFRCLTEEEIDEYVRTARFADKAGGYAIQDEGAVLVKEIHGCFYNVVGLPIGVTINLLQKFRKDCAHG